MYGNGMHYDRGTLDALVDDLTLHGKNLTNEAKNLQDCATKLINVGWEGNESAQTFHTAHGQWEVAFSDTIDKLGKLCRAVEEARDNAFLADSKVSNSFG